MDELANYRQRQSIIELPLAAESEAGEFESGPNLLAPIRLYWKMILLTFVLFSVVGLAAVWSLIQPKYSGRATIRVASIVPSVLFGSGGMPTKAYESFRNDQASFILEDQRIIQRVADDLGYKNLEFFNKSPSFLGEKPSPDEILQKAIATEDIRVWLEKDSELVRVIVTSTNRKEAIQIADAFSRAYMAIVGGN